MVGNGFLSADLLLASPQPTYNPFGAAAFLRRANAINHQQEEPMRAAEQTTANRRIVGQERLTWTKDCLHRYRAGESIRQIAGDTGRSYGFVHRILVEGGAQLRGRGGPRRRKNG